ncbi:coenzyme F420-0:L-glutamate ligase [Novosphingobium sp. PC22D]|uniref:coenzyme F420-0:L-glutamate ligase n=1 Tax=Novosphingobium sp. PC22D TaxID=1962403 RepID=UPI000BF24B21|nr:coenzyme F420-0:L-glutamate ligase [Novosphingobium sp. PC22D]PEQ11819.1 coenzyme F420-0:L-glutamate ligase [Novosphingobium sp. PC22D]
MSQIAEIRAFALPGMPLFGPETSIADEILASLDLLGETLRPGDVCVVAQKIVSKCERRTRDLATVEPDARACEIAAATGRDPRVTDLIKAESSELLRVTPAAIIARHRTGHVLANAGIDASNVADGEDERVLLWPLDPDSSARTIRAGIADRTGIRPAVVIADSMGRAWRVGTVGHAIGCAGLAVLEDRRGTGRDLFGRTLQATIVAVADSVAAAATLAMGEGDEGTPVAIVRGAERWVSADDGPGAVSGLRPLEQDMFR